MPLQSDFTRRARRRKLGPNKLALRKRAKKSSRALQMERLEDRRLLADVSPAPILQWFESSYDVIEDRTVDAFTSGYGSVWLPPPGRADISDFSVGYDVYNRFDLGRPRRPTLYGTETGLRTVADTFHDAGIGLHVDAIINHNGFSDTATPGFYESGGYPGFAITLPNDIDGDFNSGFAWGDIRGRLAGLVDIDHGKNHQFIRQPVDPNDSRNIPIQGTVPDFAGRLSNVPDPANRRFYPDLDLDPIHLFDPITGESGIPVYPFNLDCADCGDAGVENATGYLMRYLQWMVQDVGVDGFRIDAAKHVEGFALDFFDRAVYRQNPRPLLNGATNHVFSYSEVFDSNPATLLPHVKKTIDDNDPGRIGGNRDTLDFKLYFALKENLEHAGSSNAWGNIKNASLDFADDGIHNGSAGVMFVQSHDEPGPFELGNVAHAYMLMHPGNAVVYFNANQFGDNRDFPKDGRGDALGGTFGDQLSRLAQIRNTHGRGNYHERWIDDQGLFVFERESSAVVGLSNRGDSGYDSRTVQVAFAPGTHLVELTGNASNSFIDPFDDIKDVVTVSGNQTITINVPRNRNANGDWHGNGYVIYGLPTPQAGNGLELIGTDSILAGSSNASNAFENGRDRINDVHVIKEDEFQARLFTNEVRLLGLESLRDIWADGDNALLQIDGGIDINGNGHVDITDPGSVAYGFEGFGDKSSSLIGPQGLGGSRGDGEFLQTVDTTQLDEGLHYIRAIAFRHRTDGGPAVYSDFRKAFYLDRLPPNSEVLSFDPFTAGVNENRDIIIRSVDKTADNVHVFMNLPAGMTDQQILDMVNQGQGSAAEIDRDQFVFGVFDVPHGNNVVTTVTFERTGTFNIQRTPGLFTSTIIGSGLGDLNFDGNVNADDVYAFRDVLLSNQQAFNPAADFTADGLVNEDDLALFADLIDNVGDGGTNDALDDILDQIRPAVVAVTINSTQVDPTDLAAGNQPTSWTNQRSMLATIEIEFNRPMNLDAADLELTNLGQNASVDPDVDVDLANVQLETIGNTTVIDLSQVDLASGVYQLRISDTAESTAGVALDGDDDGTPGGDFNFTGDSSNRFYQQTFDFNGDNGTSVFDYSTFAYWFGTPIPAAPLYTDLNGDGGVSVFDFSHFSSNFGSGVTFPVTFQGFLAAESPDFVDDEVAEAFAGQVLERHEPEIGWSDPLRRVVHEPNSDKMFDEKLEIGYSNSVQPLERVAFEL